MTEFGEPITTEQCCWAIIKEIKSPVVGDLTKYSKFGYALDYIHKNDDQVYSMLSSGEKRLVNIAQGLYTSNEHQPGSGVAALGGLDKDTRRRVWVYIGYLIMGRDVVKDWTSWGTMIDFSKLGER